MTVYRVEMQSKNQLWYVVSMDYNSKGDAEFSMKRWQAKHPDKTFRVSELNR